MQLKRKMKGDVPVGQVILIVIAVVVAVAIWLAVKPMLGTVNVPSITLDAYNTHAFGSYAVFAVKTGVNIQYVSASLYDSSGKQLAQCTGPYNSIQDAMNKKTGSQQIPADTDFYVRCDYTLSPGLYKLMIVYQYSGNQKSVLL
ncbi:MAG: hypothetical protein ACP5HD_10650, partial [Thermoproteus sp.]